MQKFFLKKSRWVVNFSAVILTLLSIVSPAEAQVAVTPSDTLGLDQSLIKQDDRFALADSVIVAPIFWQGDGFLADEDWYRGIFYYQASRLNQGDLLFHYGLLQDGTVIEGNSKGEDQRFTLEGSDGKPIIIAYLAGRDDLDFENEAKAKLDDLLLEIINRNAINPSNIYVRDLSYVARNNEAVKISTDSMGGRWERSLISTVDAIKSQYNPVKRNYELAVEKVELPTAPVNYGDNVIVNVTIKNKSKFALFQGTDSEPLIAKTEGNVSQFYYNGIWLSLTQAPLMADGSVLKPGESAVYPIRVAIPLYFGDLSENFRLINSLGEVYPDTSFTIKMNVARLDKEVVEITDTETGQLNVRAAASGSSTIISRVTPGQRFIVLERGSGGWIKLDLGDGKSGWVVSKYTKIV